MLRSGEAVLAIGAVAVCVALWVRRRREEEEEDDEIGRLVRGNIRRLAPYRCARDDYSSGVLLDANENSFGPALSGDAREARSVEIHRYPDPLASRVREGIASLRGVHPGNVFVGVGSDEAIDLLFRVFCEPKASSVLILPPTYGMYKVCAAANDVTVLQAPLDPANFDVDVERCARTARASTRLVFVTSPGNPTSRLVSPEKVLQLHERLPRAVIVVDEAYVDCAPEAASMAPLVAEYPRLVVLHTLSKAFGLAGARVGTAVADARLVAFMNNLKAPYNVNSLTAKVAADALSDLGLARMRHNVQSLLEERATLVKELAALDCVDRIHPSDANFLLVKIRPPALAKPLYLALADEASVVVRYRGDQLHCDGCLRITVGTPADNAALLAALDRLAPGLLDRLP